MSEVFLLPIQEMQLELHLSKKRIWGKEEVVESKKTSRNQGSAEEPETRDLTHLAWQATVHGATKSQTRLSS